MSLLILVKPSDLTGCTVSPLNCQVIIRGDPGVLRRCAEGQLDVQSRRALFWSLVTLALTNLHLSRANNRHAVYWNSSNL
ncbi:unnamed protein product, partial [Gadus morhua 'NCC']